MEIFVFDKRIVQRLISDNTIKKNDYDDYLMSLKDVSEFCDDISDEVFCI
jgi:hypothetical protein